MKKVRHTGDSANVAFYSEIRTREEEKEFPQYHVQVLCWDLRPGPVVNGKKTLARRAVPEYSFTVREWVSRTSGNTEVLRFTYQPKVKPKTYRLSDRTVNRLLKEKMP